MNKQLSRLDKEHIGRINELITNLNDNKGVDTSDIFLSPPVLHSLDKPKIILESFHLKRILTAFPFTTELYVTLCPHCCCLDDQRDLQTLLEHRAITPVLTAPYRAYADPVAKVVLQYPHISYYEFSFYRKVAIVANASNALCQHCISERKSKCLEIARQTNMSKEASTLITQVFLALEPYIKPDYEILDDFGRALEMKDSEQLIQIYGVANAVWDARTTQAYQARTTLPSQHVPRLVSEAAKTLRQIPENDLEMLDNALMQDIHLEIPANMDVRRYIQTVEPFRNELSAITESLIADSDAANLSKLTTNLGTLNHELARIRRSKGLLLYRAATGFLQTNKTLIASGLLASVMGMSGNYLGCGASVIAGTGAQVAKKFGKLKMPPAGEDFFDEVKHAVRPYIHKLLSKYLNIDIRAVQLWDINEKISRSLLNSTNKSSSRSAKPRVPRKRVTKA